jgi:hypothetical protein
LLPFQLGPSRMAPTKDGEKKGHLPSTGWWLDNTPSTFTLVSLEWAVWRSSFLGTLRSENLPWRRWELQLCSLIQAQQSCLSIRNKECRILYSCEET